MSRLPALRGKTQVRFSNPLAGQVYDNTKYQYSCFFEKQQEIQSPQLSQNLNSKSVISYSLKKDMKVIDKFNTNSEANSLFLLNKRKINILDNRWLNPLKKCSKHLSKTSETFNPQKRYTSEKSKTRERIIARNKAMRFQQIEVKVLQSSQNETDFQGGQWHQKQFLIHLGRYFEMFFKNKLQGAIFQNLCMFVQSKIEQLVNFEDSSINKQQYSEQNYNITSKRALYQKLVELDKVGNKNLLKQLLLYYCVPPAETRQIFLNDLMSMISQKLNERFNLSKDQKYVLLTEKGKVIKDFAQIKFSTKRLFVAAENQLKRILDEHFNHIKLRKTAQQKCSFRQTLKNHFRNQLTKGLYEQNLNSNKSFSQQLSEKRLNLDKAEKIINLKNERHCQGRKRIKRMMQISRNKSKNNSSQETTKDVKKQANKFDKKVLSTDERLMAEFKRLKRVNDYENAYFKNEENNKYKVQFGIIARECAYFKNKSQNQIKRIFTSLPFISLTDRSDYQKQTITDEQYLELRKIIACLAKRQSIITFVDRYLCFDEYGQLQKQELKQTLLFIIGESKTSQIILMTIWSWLQKNGVIINEALSRGNMQLLYQRNKIVYYFLISLIFGTNETTALNLAEDII